MRLCGMTHSFLESELVRLIGMASAYEILASSPSTNVSVNFWSSFAMRNYRVWKLVAMPEGEMLTLPRIEPCRFLNKT